MSSKITVSLVAEVLKQHKAITPALLREIVEELNATAQSETDEPVPRTKTQFVILASLADPSTAWVLQIPEDASPTSVLDRVYAAAHAFNASKKGRLIPVKTLPEALESVPRKFFKEAGEGTLVKTKVPVAVVATYVKLPEPPTA